MPSRLQPPSSLALLLRRRHVPGTGTRGRCRRPPPQRHGGVPPKRGTPLPYAPTYPISTAGVESQPAPPQHEGPHHHIDGVPHGQGSYAVSLLTAYLCSVTFIAPEAWAQD
ncbi:hypothetical protein PYW07_011687 [Mythimna separata]|uniref:Uncharacterized protein n=1 Tax=Mythimna separata TaxID=271217 RepID=A0AAD8DKF2_MYTSE|nr:hypothetical protein PYW07_011687 [Mythimna separata]